MTRRGSTETYAPLAPHTHTDTYRDLEAGVEVGGDGLVDGDVDAVGQTEHRQVAEAANGVEQRCQPHLFARQHRVLVLEATDQLRTTTQRADTLQLARTLFY